MSALEFCGEATESSKQASVKRMGGLVKWNLSEQTNEAFENLAYEHDQEEE